MKNVYRILMIGFGAGLITLGFIGVVASNWMEVQSQQNWILAGQRAGSSVASFTLNLSTGEYKFGVWLWVHNSAEGFYSISDVDGNQLAILMLKRTEQSSEWKYSEEHFQIADSGYYTFELFNATFSSTRSTAKLYQKTYVNEYLHPYRSLFLVGTFSLVMGVPLVIVGLISLLTPKP